MMQRVRPRSRSAPARVLRSASRTPAASAGVVLLLGAVVLLAGGAAAAGPDEGGTALARPDAAGAGTGASAADAAARPRQLATADPALPPAAGDNPLPYANTPPELRPYSRFVQQPYSRFFVDKMDYYGPGRRKPEPEVDVVKIGLITPLERTVESYIGQDILRGTELAIEEANAAGGYQGKPFVLAVRNDTGLWGATANEVIDLVYEEGARLIIGTVDGANTHIAMRVVLKLEVPLINVGDLDPTLAETKIPWVFRVAPDDRQQAYTIAFYLYKQLGLSRVAILRANNRYGRIGVGEFIASSVRLKRPAPIEINYETSWERTNPNFAMQIDRLRAVDFQALVLWADAKPAGQIVRRLREAGIGVPIFACDRIIHPEFFSEAGEHAEGVVAAATYDPGRSEAVAQDFRLRYHARFGHEPSSYAAHGYDGTALGIAAIREAGLNWAKIRDAIERLSGWQGATGPIAFEHDLSNRRRVTLATARNGTFVHGEPQTEAQF